MQPLTSSSLVLSVAAAILAAPSTSALDQQIANSRIVLATVTDSQNRIVVDIEADDFQIDEDGQSRDVLEARIADYPVVVLLDNGPTARSDLESIRRAAAGFIARLGERAVAVGTMARPPEMLASFDDDRPTVLARLDKLTISTAPLAPLEALAAAARMIHDADTPFSAVVVVASRPIQTEPEPSGLLTAVLESRTFVHAVERTQAVEAIPSGTEPAPGGGDLLSDVSTRTGGQLTTVYSPVSYSAALDSLADRLAAEFMVEYPVPAGSTLAETSASVCGFPG